MTNPLRLLKKYGQSVWYDNIDRAQLASGAFLDLLRNDNITGVTANPSTFEKAMASGHAYDQQIQQLVRMKKSTKDIYEALVVTDVRLVADLLSPIYRVTQGKDGFVSLEVSPSLAHDTEGTLREVRFFWEQVNCPNAMIKIPATPAGIPAIRQALYEGINVNVTLIFSLENYRQVAEAYISALEARLKEGLDIRQIASVASFFVSRLDVLADSRLAAMQEATQSEAERQHLANLAGKAAIANTRLVYQEFLHIFHSARFEALKRYGAQVQRPLWASTSTKNPAYRDVLYAEELIGPNTIDTMPLETIVHFRDHGKVRRSIDEDIEQAAAVMAELEQCHIHYDQVTQQLQDEGIQKFIDAFDTMHASLANKQNAFAEKISH